MQYVRTLWELMERRVDATPDALMVVDEDMRTLTFAEFWAEAELAAAGLAAVGIGADDVVTWQLPTWIESLVLAAALARLGAVQHPCPPSCHEDELEELVGLVGATLLVTPSTWRGAALEESATAVARRRGGLRVLVADRALPQGDPTTLAPLPPAPPADEQSVRWLFTAPTDGGAPMVAAHTDASLLAAARALSQRIGLIPQDRHSMVLPVTHVDGIVWLLASLESGCANICCEFFDPERTVEVLGREGVTLAGSGSRFHEAYLDEQRRRLEPIFTEVRAFVGGGRPMPGLADEVRRLFDVPVLGAYSPVEAPMASMVSPHEPAAFALGEGTPTTGVELRIVDDAGEQVPTGVVGRIRVRGPQVMRGYLTGPLGAQADAGVDAEGFVTTGDLGQLEEAGALTVTWHRDDVVLLPDVDVSVKELERLLREEPDG